MSYPERFRIDQHVDLLNSRFDKKPREERIIQGAGMTSFGSTEETPNPFSKLHHLRSSLTESDEERASNFRLATESGILGRQLPSHLQALIEKYPEEYGRYLKAYFSRKQD